MASSRFCLIALLLSGLVLLSGCSGSHQLRSVTPSGFLGDYSKFRSGEGDEALLIYKNPAADFSRYRRVIIEPVRVYASPKSSLGSTSKAELQTLVNYLDSKLREELRKEYTIAQQDGTDVLRIRVAITDADSSSVALDLVSTVMPIGLALSTLKSAALGAGTGVGEVQAEAEFLDSMTNTRLIAAVDRRAGSKRLSGVLDKWDDAKAAFDAWAEKIRIRLTELRKGGK